MDPRYLNCMICAIILSSIFTYKLWLVCAKLTFHILPLTSTYTKIICFQNLSCSSIFPFIISLNSLIRTTYHMQKAYIVTLDLYYLVNISKTRVKRLWTRASYDHLDPFLRKYFLLKVYPRLSLLNPAKILFCSALLVLLVMHMTNNIKGIPFHYKL